MILDPHKVLSPPRVLGPPGVLGLNRFLVLSRVLGSHRVLDPYRIVEPGSSQGTRSCFSSMPFVFKEMSLLWGPNNFFFSAGFRETHRLMYRKVELVCLQICGQFPGFLNNSIRKNLACFIISTILFKTPLFRYLSMCL